MDYYVYEVLGKDGELLYIGKGTGKRYLSHLKVLYNVVKSIMMVSTQ